MMYFKGASRPGLLCGALWCYLLLQVSGYGLGPCPKKEFLPSFNITAFSGHWYEIERSFYLMELISSCVRVDLEKNEKNQLEVMVNSRSRMTGVFSISEGIATQTKKDPSVLLYKVSSKLPRMISRYLPGAGYYQVLRTDYVRYAVLYSCSNFHIFHTDLVWVWARTKEIDVDLRRKIYDILKLNKIDIERLTLPSNKNCTDDY